MKFFCIRFNSSVLLSVFLTVVVIFLIFLDIISVCATGPLNASTNQERVLFIKSLGIEVDDTKCSSKEVIIPNNFSDVYEEYNKIQKQAGFNLSDYKGTLVTVYQYPVKDLSNNIIVSLMVHNGIIIGGDISSTSFRGFMYPLLNGVLEQNDSS